jgi:histidinol-phosphatase (PHP family)
MNANPANLPDHHVHTEWSWDARNGSMEESCRRAIEIGLPSIAFTEHADWLRGPDAVVDIAGYLECVATCRERFPELRILSGIEMGEPHQHRGEVADIMASGRPDRVLASLHYMWHQSEAADASKPGFMRAEFVDEVFRDYLGEMMTMIESDLDFDVLAHLDYPKRYWPEGSTFDEARFEDELRGVLRALAKRGAALEINTTRGREPERGLCPGPTTVRWWREEGGRALAFGSDAHAPEVLAAGFELAAQVAEAAGFQPQDDPSAYWLA